MLTDKIEQLKPRTDVYKSVPGSVDRVCECNEKAQKDEKFNNEIIGYYI